MADNAAALRPEDLPPYVDPKGRKIMPRHLRKAMLRAKQNGLHPHDGNHALYLLAENGFDVLDQDEPMLNRVKPVEKQAPARKKDADAPSPQERAASIAEIQRGLVKRRRRRLRGLLARLAVFVLLPTAIVGWYFFTMATEMYETDSAFVIQTSEAPSPTGGLGNILAGTGLATSQDSIVVQEYLGSREAFLRLERDFGLSAHFQNPEIDPVQRLPADASLDAAYDYFRDKVTIGYDPTEGVIRMTVIAATPEASQQFSEALVSYAEERVDGLSQAARGDQLEDAIARYQEAEEAMLDAQQRVLTLQQQRGVLSAEVELTSQMSIINALELEAETKRLALAEVLDNARPNSSRADILEREIARIDARIAALRGELTQTSDNSVSLARTGAELQVAESELATRHLILQEAIAAMESARLEVNRQTRYLSLGVSPVAPTEPTYPRKVENTALAFIIFASVYLLLSLTVSILREQVSV